MLLGSFSLFYVIKLKEIDDTQVILGGAEKIERCLVSLCLQFSNEVTE